MEDNKHILIIDSICEGWQPASFIDDEPSIAANRDECIKELFETCYDDIAQIYYEMKQYILDNANTESMEKYLDDKPEANINSYEAVRLVDFKPGERMIWYSPRK